MGGGVNEYNLCQYGHQEKVNNNADKIQTADKIAFFLQYKYNF